MCAIPIVKSVFSHIVNLFIYLYSIFVVNFPQSGKRIKLIRTLLTMRASSGMDYRCAFLRIRHFVKMKRKKKWMKSLLKILITEYIPQREKSRKNEDRNRRRTKKIEKNAKKKI